jgi:AraC-like DNA-binding protein
MKPYDLHELLVQESARKWMLDDSDISVVDVDEEFIIHAREIIEKNFSDPCFCIESYSKKLGLSRSHLHRKFKAIIDLSPGHYVRTYRLNHARRMLESNCGNIAQIAYQCGFNSPSSFTEAFKREFGFPPSSVRKTKSLRAPERVHV